MDNIQDHIKLSATLKHFVKKMADAIVNRNNAAYRYNDEDMYNALFIVMWISGNHMFFKDYEKMTKAEYAAKNRYHNEELIRNIYQMTGVDVEAMEREFTKRNQKQHEESKR